MKTILITAPNSGSGKTTVTMGLLRALCNMGLKLCAFKTGPDYIDRAFLGKAGRCDAGNLDMHLQGMAGLKQAFSMLQGDYCIMEGAMGYFDGIYNTCQNSSYEIGHILGVPAVLVYTPKGEMFSAIPKIKGMAEFEASAIKAVIFNNVTQKQYDMLKAAVEAHTGLKVLGYLPKLEEASLQSRHLGLVQSEEIDDLDSRIEAVAQQLVKNVDIQDLLELMKDIRIEEAVETHTYDVKVAVARDRAFSFYYTENLRLLESSCQVLYFSPIEDEAVPPCDLIYFGGGYPELFKEELSQNRTMLASIRRHFQRGGHIYAECGGYMYLTECIDEVPMVGILPGRSTMTGKLQNFGYLEAQLQKDCMLGKKGETLTAHEFHKSLVQQPGEPVLHISKTMGAAGWEGGVIKQNVFGGYPHISFLGNRQLFHNLMKHVEERKK
jgi:cobyrinic acid a,c-diamide synthase